MVAEKIKDVKGTKKVYWEYGDPNTTCIPGTSNDGWNSMPEVWIGIGLCVGTILNWKFVAARLRTYTEKTDSLTLSTFFERRFKDPTGAIRVISALIILIFFTIYSSSGMVASGKLFQMMFGIDYTTAVLIGALVIVAYTFLGGFLAVCWTDLIQGVLMIIAIVVVPILAMSQPVFHNCPGWPTYELTEVTYEAINPKDGFTAEVFKMNAHTATHLDAPFHFFPEGKKIDEMPIEGFQGEAVIIDLRGIAPDTGITSEHLKPYADKIKEGDIVLMKAESEFVDYASKDQIVIGIVGGDGIGPFITAEAEKVLAFLLKDDVEKERVVFKEIDGLTIENRAACGKAIPDDVLAELKECDVILKGPTTTPREGDKWPNIESANVAMAAQEF